MRKLHSLPECYHQFGRNFQVSSNTFSVNTFWRKLFKRLCQHKWLFKNWLWKYIDQNHYKSFEARLHPMMKKIAYDQECNENQSDFILADFSSFISWAIFIPLVSSQVISATGWEKYLHISSLVYTTVGSRKLKWVPKVTM